MRSGARAVVRVRVVRQRPGRHFTAATCDPGSAQFDSILGWYDAATGEGRCEDDSCGVRSRLSAALPAGPGLRVLTVDSRSPAGPAFSVPYEFR